MSEAKQPGFFQKLDAWTDEAIIEPLLKGGATIGVGLQLQIRGLIRQKVLESYRNGQSARQRHAISGGERRATSYGR